MVTAAAMYNVPGITVPHRTVYQAIREREDFCWSCNFIRVRLTNLSVCIYALDLSLAWQFPFRSHRAQSTAKNVNIVW